MDTRADPGALREAGYPGIAASVERMRERQQSMDRGYKLGQLTLRLRQPMDAEHPYTSTDTLLEMLDLLCAECHLSEMADEVRAILFSPRKT